MAKRNPNIPSERRQEMEERTEIHEERANRRYAEKEATIKEKSGADPGKGEVDASEPDPPREENAQEDPPREK